MQTFVISRDLDRATWDAFVDGHPGATAYHQYAWKSVIEKSFGHAPYFLACLDASGTPQGVLPLVHMKSLFFGNFLVSVPFVNYGGLLCNSIEAEQTLLEEAERLRNSCGARHVELRHVATPLAELPTRDHKVTMVLPLSADAESQWRVFNCKVRNQIRKAEKSQLSSVSGHLDLLDDFYTVFARNMHDLGTPVYGKEFFRNVLEQFPYSTRIFAVRFQGKTIAAGMAFWYKQTIEVPWASSIYEYRPLCPNDLLYWDAIKFAIEQQFETFDFGRSTPNEGTFHFKKQWGAAPVKLYWQYLSAQGNQIRDLSPKNPKFSLAIKAWKRLPLGLTNLLGPHIICHIP